MVIGGVLDGTIVADDQLELQGSAVVNGDIDTKSIVVLEGARINGVVRMQEIQLLTAVDGATRLASTGT